MCTHSRLIKNKKYEPNKKNGGIAPEKKSPLTSAVPIKCGVCYECKKTKARDWQIRLSEEIKDGQRRQFITLTFNTEALQKLAIGTITKGYELDNDIASKALRLFMERWRKKYKKYPRYWMVTELGGTRYEHVHIHGIMTLNEEQEKELTELWAYGYVYIGYACNNETIGYITKYINKQDKEHPNYKPIIRASLGTGANYLNSNKAKLDKAQGYYTTKTGHRVAIPEYYRLKMWTDDERENKWIEKLESGIRWIGGIKTNEKNRNEVERAIAKNRIKNKDRKSVV